MIELKIFKHLSMSNQMRKKAMFLFYVQKYIKEQINLIKSLFKLTN